MRDTTWLKKWWWVFCFSIGALCLYFHNIQDKKDQKFTLLAKINQLQEEKLAELLRRDILKQTIASQSDPSWIEMVLMQGLGVVPEGWIKVHFTK